MKWEVADIFSGSGFCSGSSFEHPLGPPSKLSPDSPAESSTSPSFPSSVLLPMLLVRTGVSIPGYWRSLCPRESC